MFPHVQATVYTPPQEPVPNYSRQRATIRRLTEALYDFLTLDYDDHEAEVIETNAKNRRGPVIGMDNVMQVQDRLEKLRDQLETSKAKAEEAIEGMPEEMRPMARLQMEGLLITPIAQQIEFQESMLSALQKQMESQSPLGEGTIEG